jgi:hypothetical protein
MSSGLSRGLCRPSTFVAVTNKEDVDDQVKPYRIHTSAGPGFNSLSALWGGEGQGEVGEPYR